MKIVLAAKCVYPFHPYGGVQKYVYYFAKHLIAQGVEVEIVAPLDQGKPRTEYFEGIKYTLISPCISSYLELPIGWLGVHLFACNLANYLKGKEFDILHSFDLTGLYYLGHKKRKPVIAHIFSDNYLCNPISIGHYLSLFGHKPDDIKKTKIALSPFASLRDILQYPAQFFLKTRPMHKYLSQCERVFLEGDYFKEEVVRIFRLDPTKAAVVAVGTDVGYVKQQMQATGLTRDKVGFSKDDLILSTVNRLAADKGIDQMILALKILRQTIANAKLLIVGKGYQEQELLDLVVANNLQDHVRLVKDVKEEDLYGYYKISDIYLCAFSFPGSSISTLEAMSASLPIITSAQPWLVEGGRNGVYIPQNDALSIAQAVLGLKVGDLPLQGDISLNIVKDYDWPVIVSKAKVQYSELLKRFNPSRIV